eukprot:Amastigsp_a4999_12.p3 type:complete len:181 gc:universal Amastigsp_a4999_12:707-1249(+)
MTSDCSGRMVVALRSERLRSQSRLRASTVLWLIWLPPRPTFVRVVLVLKSSTNAVDVASLRKFDRSTNMLSPELRVSAAASAVPPTSEILAAERLTRVSTDERASTCANASAPASRMAFPDRSRTDMTGLVSSAAPMWRPPSSQIALAARLSSVSVLLPASAMAIRCPNSSVRSLASRAR